MCREKKQWKKDDWKNPPTNKNYQNFRIFNEFK